MTNPPPPQRPQGPYEQSLNETRASRKALEAKLAAAQRRRRLAAVGAVVAVVAGAVGGVMWWTGRDQSSGTVATSSTRAKQCASLTPITIWSAQSMQPAAVALAKAFQARPEAPCVDYQVIGRKPIEAMIGLGKGQPNRPDGWIPDAPAWVDKVNAAASLSVKPALSFARSPIVIAMDPTAASKLGQQPSWLELVASDTPIRISDPRSTTAGMLALAGALPLLTQEQARAVIPALARQASSSTDQLFADYKANPAGATAFPVSEADLIEHNRVDPSHKMVSVTPKEGTPSFEYSLVDVAEDPTKAQAVEDLSNFLRTPDAAKILASFGLRSTTQQVSLPTMSGSVGEVTVGNTPSLEQISAATDTWQAATTDFSLLSVFDVSGSMNEKVGPYTRVAITQEAAGIALNALPKSTRLALWVFSIDKGGPGQDWKEIVPYGLLSDNAHRAQMAAAAGSLSKQVGGGTGLYDTIWAAFQKAKANYDPNRVNAVVVLTDGKNDDDNGLTLDQLKANIRKADDPTKPVAITTIGIGPDVDPSALTQISQLTHTKYYGAPSPADMTTVLARALFDHQCKDGRCI